MTHTQSTATHPSCAPQDNFRSCPTAQSFNDAPSPSPPVHSGQYAFQAIDIEQAMHSLSLAQPNNASYMDTGATPYMTSDRGILHPYVTMCGTQSIIVGNGSKIPIKGYGCAQIPSSTPLYYRMSIMPLI